MKLLKIEKLPSSDSKKYEATFLKENGKEKKVKFGSAGYRDYILMNDTKSKFYLIKMVDKNIVKQNYINRHKKREDWSNPMTPGSLSRFILWNRKTFNSSLKDFKKKFKL